MAGEVEKAQAAKAAVESSIAKVREAQQKFEERKKQVEEAKAKAEAAIKKAKELQQKLKETQALFKTPGGVKGGIAAIAASQIGTLKAALVSQLQKQVLAILNKFSGDCPKSKELERIIKVRNTLLNHLTSFEKRISVFENIATKLTTIVTLVNVLIKVITSIPIPTAIIPPQVGGIGVPLSVPNKFGAALVKLNKILDRLQGDAAAILAVVTTVNLVIKNLKSRLESIDIAIQQCSIGQPADLNEILAAAQPPTSGIAQDPVYKNYTLSIIQDLDSPKIAPRRYAIAKDKNGTIRLRGDSSFSSDTQVLLDELKFKIDNQFT